MIRAIILTISVLFSLHSFSQEWIKQYGNGLNANAYYIIESYDLGYLIAAQIQYGKYLWIIKTDINGEILWDKKIGTGQESHSFSPMNIEQTLDNGYIISGSTTKYGSFDAFIIKLNFCAEIEWCKVFITPTNFDEGFRVKPTPEGGYVLLGGYFLTDPYSNVSLFKFNAAGDLIWHQFYPLDSLYYDDQPQDLTIDYDGYLITSDRYYPDPGQTGGGTLRTNYIKTDTAGGQIWNTVYVDNGYYYSRPWASKKNQHGQYYTACTHTIYSSGDNPAIIKVLHDGYQSYNHDIISTGTFNLSGMGTIDFLNDTNLVMFGGWMIADTESNVVVKTDTFGNLRKSKELPQSSKAFTNAAKTFDNKFISIANDATGGSWKIYAVKVNSDLEYDSIYTYPFIYDSLCPHQIISDTVDPDCDNVYVGIDEPFKDPQTTKLKAYPNPSSELITIEMPKYLVVSNTTSQIPSTTIYHQWSYVLLEIYDLFGRKMVEKEIPRPETTLEIDVSRWPAGIYLCKLTFNKQTVGSVKVVVE